EVILANRAKWTAALRSGDYAQGKEQLALNDYTSFCCLGVACEVLGADYGVRREYEPNMITGLVDPNPGMYSWDWSDPDDPESEPQPPWEFGELPQPLILALGLTYQVQGTLTDMNDKDEASFAEIADYVDTLPIVRNPLGY